MDVPVFRPLQAVWSYLLYIRVPTTYTSVSQAGNGLCKLKFSNMKSVLNVV